jgi:DNA-directed RNA polymerase subunit RPC12/RpoP
VSKNKEVLKRHKFWLPILSFLAKGFLLSKYKIGKIIPFTIDRKKQYLFLSNHALPIDPMFIEMYYRSPIYFVATEQILNLGFASKLLQYFFNLIPISKGLADTGAIKKMLRIRNEGGSIGIFPEGNTEYIGRPNYINPSIVKLIRTLKLPIVFINSYGLTFCTNRWSLTKKYGKCGYQLRSVVEYSTYDKLSDQELYELICDSLDINAYVVQKEQMNIYRGKNRALGLERLVFVCPKCGEVFSTSSQGNYLHCHSCGEDFLYDEWGYLNIDQKQYSMEELYAKVKMDYLHFLDEHSDGSLLFKEEGFLMISKRLRKKKVGIIKLRVTSEGFDITFKQDEYHLNYDAFKIAIQGKRQIIIYPQVKSALLIRFKTNVAPLKFLIAYQFYHKKLLDYAKEQLFIQHYGL